MTTLTPQNFESIMDRPSDQPWTAEQNASYATARAETVRLANERSAHGKNGVWTLVGGEWTATFSAQGDTVTLVHARKRYSWRRNEQPITMTRKEARAEWKRLINAGYTRF